MWGDIMPRFYVKNDMGQWNIWSTIADGYIFDSFVPFDELKKYVIEATIRERNRELDTLLTNRPELNTMSFKECEEIRASIEENRKIR